MPTLVDLRNDLALTQGEVAAQIGVSEQAVWNWENQKAKPSAKNIRALAALYDKKIVEIRAAIEETNKVRAAA